LVSCDGDVADTVGGDTVVLADIIDLWSRGDDLRLALGVFATAVLARRAPG
jgi:hypothetical protein